MQLATLLKNMLSGDIPEGKAVDFARMQNLKPLTWFDIDLTDEKNNLFSYLIWPMNTFHIIARIFDTYDVYQNIVSLENDDKILSQLDTGKHARTWFQSLLATKSNTKILISARFYRLLYELFSPSKIRTNIDELLKDPNYLRSLFELYVASDTCSYDLKPHLYQNSNTLITLYMEQLKFRKSGSTISSYSVCSNNYGLIQYKTHTPQSGISLNSLSHDLAYIKPGIEVVALVGESDLPRKPSSYNILILPWPLEIRDEFFKEDERATLIMDEEFGFFTYENNNTITVQMIIYAIECAIHSTCLPDLIVIPECAIGSNQKEAIKQGLIEYFFKCSLKAPVLIFGVFGEGQTGSYGENSLELLYNNLYTESYVGENQSKHHRWALDKSQLNAYGLSQKLSLDKVKWWENCSIGDRKLISYRDECIHICPLICEDLARQEPIAPVVRALGPDLVVALLLDGPQMKGRWSDRYSSALVDDPGCSVLSISPYGMTRRSTNNGEFEPSPIVALWSDTKSKYELELCKNKVGIILELEFEEEKQWSADGRGENKNRLFYKSYTSIGDEKQLNSLM